MRLRRFVIWTLVSVALAGCQTDEFSSLATTEYTSEDDVYVVFHGQVFEDASQLLPVSLIGKLAFALQEGTHENITHVSGAEVDHYYIWLCLEDACIPVDPFTYSS